MNTKRQFLEFAKHLEQSKGLNAEWPIAVRECVNHLKQEAGMIDDEPIYTPYRITKQDIERIRKVRGH